MFSREHLTSNASYKKEPDGVYLQRTMNAVTPGRSSNGQVGSATGYSAHYAGNSKQQSGQLVPNRNSENATYYGPSTSKFEVPQWSNRQVGSATSYSTHLAGNSKQQCGQVVHNRNSENATYYGPSTSKFGMPQWSSVGGNATTTKLPLMSKPTPTPYSNPQKKAATDVKAIRESSSETNCLKMRRFGDSEREKMCVLTGTVERIIKYGKIFQNHFCLFQVFGSVISIADGKVQFEKTMLLRDKKGPILQLTYYSNATHINIEDFHLGQNLRAVGRMIGPNVMSAISIRAATDEELEILPRLCYISDYAVSALCGSNQPQSKP